MVKRLEFFLLKSYNKCFTSRSFFLCWSNLIQSRLYVCSASWKELCSCIIFLLSLLITYFITLILEKRKIVLEKVWKKCWILDPKIGVNPDTNTVYTHAHPCTYMYMGHLKAFLTWQPGKNSRILKKVKRRWCYIHANFYVIFLPGTTSW